MDSVIHSKESARAILTDQRPTWAEIHLDHLAHNYQIIRSHLGQDVRIMAVVKADAYGHGAIPIAHHLEKLGVDWFAVALPEEGEELRRAEITKPILCLGGFWEGQAELVVENNLTPAVFELDTLEKLNAEARRREQRVDYHLKVDTGMGRLGVPADSLSAFLARARDFAHVHLDGVLSHFACAGNENGRAFTSEQLELFNELMKQVRGAGFNPRYRHLANSAAMLAYPDSRMEMVRPGAALYGLKRDVLPPDAPDIGLKPVLSLRTRIMYMKAAPTGTALGYGVTFRTRRPSRIATLPIGYHDGYSRALSNRGTVLVHGQRAPIVGRVSMDLTLVDVTEIEGARVGDQVTLIGRDNDDEILAEELANQAGTISYEIVCGIGQRVPRLVVP